MRELPNGQKVRVTIVGTPKYRAVRDRGGSWIVRDNLGRVYSSHKDKGDADAHVKDLRAAAKRKAAGARKQAADNAKRGR